MNFTTLLLIGAAIATVGLYLARDEEAPAISSTNGEIQPPLSLTPVAAATGIIAPRIAVSSPVRPVRAGSSTRAVSFVSPGGNGGYYTIDIPRMEANKAAASDTIW